MRHGRSAHVHRGWLDRAAFLRWLDAYEAAGIDERERPPAELAAFAADCDVIAASTAPRAIESARLLAPQREIATSPLLREMQIAPPNIRVRLPLLAWALAYGLRSLIRPHAPAAEQQRAAEAAAWLEELARRHGSVLAVTHGWMRSTVARQLGAAGWRCAAPRRSHHWSVWTLTR